MSSGPCARTESRKPDACRLSRLLGVAVLGTAFLIPLSISLAEGFCFLSIALWLALAVRGRSAAELKSPLTPWVFAFAFVAVVSGLRGLHPELSTGRFHRLALGFFPFAVLADCRWAAGDVRARLLRLAQAFIAGCGLLAVFDLVRIPIELSRGVRLFDTGNMRDPQFHMVALCLLLVLSRRIAARFGRWSWTGLAGLAALGLLLHFKRGVWLSFGVVFAAAALLLRKRRWLLALAAGAVLLLALPQTRSRLMDLRSIGHIARGDRAAIWSEVAPGLIADHPWGLGYMALTHEDMLRYSRNIQPGLNHLHNNVLQIRLELGWLGIAVWLAWMGVPLWLLARAARAESKSGGALAPVGQAALAAFSALLLNGMVEYNFGDTEILMAYQLLMGIAAALGARTPPR